MIYAVGICAFLTVVCLSMMLFPGHYTQAQAVDNARRHAQGKPHRKTMTKKGTMIFGAVGALIFGCVWVLLVA